MSKLQLSLTFFFSEKKMISSIISLLCKSKRKKKSIGTLHILQSLSAAHNYSLHLVLRARRPSPWAAPPSSAASNVPSLLRSGKGILMSRW